MTRLEKLLVLISVILLVLLMILLFAGTNIYRGQSVQLQATLISDSLNQVRNQVLRDENTEIRQEQRESNRLLAAQSARVLAFQDSLRKVISQNQTLAEKYNQAKEINDVMIRNRELDRQAFNTRYLLMKDMVTSMVDSLGSRQEKTVAWLQSKEHEGRYLDTNRYGVFETFVKGDSVHTIPLEIYNKQTVKDVREEAVKKPGLLSGKKSSRIKGTIQNSNPVLPETPFSTAYEYKERTLPKTRKVKHKAKAPRKKLKYLNPS